MALSTLLLKTKSELAPLHQHYLQECYCNIHGSMALKYLMTPINKNKNIITAFLLKFYILYRDLELYNIKQVHKWVDDFNLWHKNCNNDEHVYIPIKLPIFNTKKFDNILKELGRTDAISLYINNDNVTYIPVKKSCFKVSRIYYPDSFTNRDVFDILTVNDNGKWFTYLLKDQVKTKLSQLNTILILLDQLITHPTDISDINFEQVKKYGENIENSNFLYYLLQDNNSREDVIKSDIQLLDDMLKNIDIFNILEIRYNQVSCHD